MKHKKILACALSLSLILSPNAFVPTRISALDTVNIKGDIDSDGLVTSSDMRTLEKYLLGVEPITQQQITAADMNSDGSVNSFDMPLLRKAFINGGMNLKAQYKTDQLFSGYNSNILKTAFWEEKRADFSAIIHNENELNNYIASFFESNVMDKCIEQYNESFFEKNVLLVNTIYQPCGTSLAFETTNINCTKNRLNVTSTWKTPASTDGAASAVFIQIALPKEDYQNYSLYWSVPKAEKPVVTTTTTTTTTTKATTTTTVTTTAPVTTTTATTAPKPADDIYTTYKVTVYLNVREAANVDSKAIGSIPPEAEFKVISNDNLWAYVDYNGLKGWVNSGYIIKKGTTQNTYKYKAALNKLNAVGWNLQSAFNAASAITYYGHTDDMPQDSKTTMEWYASYGFKNGKGNCYVMAAMFCEMAKCIGYEAHQISGKVPLRAGGYGPHSWVEVTIDGTVYVCDPDFTNETGRNGYMIAYGQSGTWRYEKEEVMS